ncbi:MAG: GAF domain-containing protein [candidate division Zixibacteria bacterium]|nr:GAF domain-containing protein [candidate division Zixibacteria bacterium]
MSPNLSGLFLTSVLLVFALVLYFVKKRIPHSDDWIKIYIGLGLTFAGRFINLLDGTLGVDFPAFLSGSNRIVIEGAICYLGGSIFLMAGFADLAPGFFKLLKGEKHDVRNRYLYNSVNSILYPGCKLKSSTRGMMNYIRNNFKLKGMYVHLISATGGTLKLYNGIADNVDDSWLKLDIPIKASMLGKALVERRVFRSEVFDTSTFTGKIDGKSEKVKFIGIPIITGIKPWGVVGLLVDPDYDEREGMERFLKYFAERIGICLDYEKISRENETKSKYLKLHLSATEVLNKWPDLNASLPKVAQELKKYIDFEFLHLARLDDSGEGLWRFVYSEEGKSLVARGVDSATLEDNLLGKVVRGKKPDIFNYEKPEEENGNDTALLEEGASCIGVPLFKDKRLTGALVLSANFQNVYDSSDLNMLRFLAPVLAEYIDYLNLKDKFYKRERRLSRLAKGFSTIYDREGLRKALREAAETITNELPITSCRIMLLEHNNEYFRTVGLFQLRKLAWQPESLKMVEASSVPAHYRATLENRPMIADMGSPNPSIKPRESNLLFYEGLKTALLIPISNGENVLGVMSLGEMRSQKRHTISGDELNFAMAIASRIGLALETYSLQRKLVKIKSGKDASPEGMRTISNRDWNKYRNRLMNALSGIMGSSELLSSSNAGTMDSRMSKYFGIIQRNGERIKTLTSEFENSAVSDSPAVSRVDRARQIKEILTS